MARLIQKIGPIHLRARRVPVLQSLVQAIIYQQLNGKAADTIPNSVTTIGSGAFSSCAAFTTVTIPDSVTSLGGWAFSHCRHLTNVAIPSSITAIGALAFARCTNLTSATLPRGVTTIGDGAFLGCGLTNLTIPESVTVLGCNAFGFCANLAGVCFGGNAPSGETAFDNSSNTVYYLPGTIGWSLTFGGRPTALWRLPYPLILDFPPGFGVQSNGFGFIISWATNGSVVVEGYMNLGLPSAWSPIATNTLTDGWCYFADPDWVHHPARFYRSRAL